MSIFSRKLLQQLLLQAGILISAVSPALIQASDSGLQLAVKCVDCGSHDESMPLFAPFDWSAQPSYAIQGTAYNNVSGTTVPPNPVTYVVDPANQRILYDLTPHGKFYIFENESFVTGLFPTCTRVLKADGTNFTFADQVAGYLNVLSMLHSTTSHPKYFGRAADVGSCPEERIAVEIHLKDGYLSEFDYTQLLPVEGLGCAYVSGFTQFDHSTIKHHNLDQYFDLSADCTAAAPSYCPLIYPTGNACCNCQ